METKSHKEERRRRGRGCKTSVDGDQTGRSQPTQTGERRAAGGEMDRNREGVGLETNGGPGGHEDRCEDRARGARERQGAHGRDKPAEKNAGAQPRQQGRSPTPTFPAGVGDGGQPESSRPVPG